MKTLKLLAMSALLFGGVACSPGGGQGFEVDTMKTADGKELKITFIRHGSLALEYDGHDIYVDPVGEYADYARMPKADVILVTHEHDDHLDPQAVNVLRKTGTVVVSTPEVLNRLPWVSPMKNGEELDVTSYLHVRAVPAYNTSEGRTQFHPEGRGNGYVLTLGGTTIYIAGDTENIADMAHLGPIDIAFLPVNQPYTMTPGQAVDALSMVKPKVFYPYHYGLTDTETDIESLRTLLDGTGIELRIRQMP